MGDLCPIRRPNNSLVVDVFSIPGSYPCEGMLFTRTMLAMVEGPSAVHVERWVINSWDAKDEGDCEEYHVEYLLTHELKTNNSWKLLEVESFTARWNAAGKYIGTNGRTCWETDDGFNLLEEIDRLKMARTGTGITWITTAPPCPGIKIRNQGICECPNGFIARETSPCCEPVEPPPPPPDPDPDPSSCPDGWIHTPSGCVLPQVNQRWYAGRPCDFGIYVSDNWELERDGNGCRIPRPDWQVVTIDGVTGYRTGGVGYGDIIIPEGPICYDGVWWFRNPDEICSSGEPICWYQQFLWFMAYPNLPQSTIVRTPGIEGDAPPGAPAELTSISLIKFPPLVINEFYTFGECP